MDLPFDVDVDEGSQAEAAGAPLALRVLIVDDEAVVRDVLHRVLSREPDLAVATAENAEQAVAYLKDQRVDVLLADKNLPGRTGLSLIAEARRMQPLLEAILVTGYASGESVLAALAVGASDYLTKPFDQLQVVSAKVRAALERRAERVKNRRVARAAAKQASDLMGQGTEASEEEWERLEAAFTAYDAAVRDGAQGQVRVVGQPDLCAQLEAADLRATLAEVDDGSLALADVVVVSTQTPNWRTLVEQLSPLSPDVLLFAGPEADLPDLLEAISMRLELVGFGGQKSGGLLLSDRVRSLLMRRGVQRAQGALAEALAHFRESLKPHPR